MSNRVLSRKWEEREQAFHNERLRSIRATLDTAKPALGSATRARSKKEQMEEDRVLVIEQENRKLLERMSAIITAKSTVQTAASRNKSLNREFRKKELTRVALENQALLKRLQNRQSSYSTEQWRHDRKDTERLLRNICQYPYVLGADSPSDLRRQMSQPQLLPSLPDSARLSKPRVLPPLKPAQPETVLKRGLSLGEKYFMVEVLVLKSKIKLKAMDVETQDRFVLKLTKAEARDIVGEGRDRYEKLVERLAFQSQGLVMLGKRKPGKSATGKDSASENPKEATSLPPKPVPKPKPALNPPALKRPIPSNHTNSEPNLMIPRKEPVPEAPIEHFPTPKPSTPSSEEGKRDKQAIRSSSPEDYEDEHYEEDEKLPESRKSSHSGEGEVALPEPLAQEEVAERELQGNSMSREEGEKAKGSIKSPASHRSASSSSSSAKKSSESSDKEEKYEEDEDFQPVSSGPIGKTAVEQAEIEESKESVAVIEQGTDSPKQDKSREGQLDSPKQAERELQGEIETRKPEEIPTDTGEERKEVIQQSQGSLVAEQLSSTTEQHSPPKAVQPEGPIKPSEEREKSPFRRSESPENPPQSADPPKARSPTDSPVQPQAQEETHSPSQPVEDPTPPLSPEKAENEPQASGPSQDVGESDPVEPETNAPAQESAVFVPFQELPEGQRPRSPEAMDLEAEESQPLEEEKRPISPEKAENEREIQENPMEIAAESSDFQGNSKPEVRNIEEISPSRLEDEGEIGKIEGNPQESVEKPIFVAQEEEFSADLKPNFDQSGEKVAIEAEIKQEERPQSPSKPIEASEAAEIEPKADQREEIEKISGENEGKGGISPEPSSEALPILPNIASSDPVQPSDSSPQP